MPEYPEIIRKALNNRLPGKSSHIKMLPENRKLTAELYELEKAKHSSVLLLLFEENNVLKALLTKRPAHMKHHAGQISLPGGRIEKDETPLTAVLRETAEETGLDGNQIEILGELTPLYVQVSRFHIHPFVGWINNIPVCEINKNEVDKIIHFPIRNMGKQIELIDIETITGKIEVPCIRFDAEIIWGATAMILMEFYDSFKLAEL